MASSTRNQARFGSVDLDEEQHGQLVACFCEGLVDDYSSSQQHGGGVEAPSNDDDSNNKRVVSRLAVQGSGGGGLVARSPATQEHEENDDGRRGRTGGGVLPPPHAWLSIQDDDAWSKKRSDDDDQGGEHRWARLLRGGGGGRHQQQQRRSSFSVPARRDKEAREAWLDRAWEMKRTWHERNGGAPDADTPVVVVVGNNSKEVPAAEHHHVAMVRACRDLGLELPPDCTVDIQCFGLSTAGDSSPTHHHAGSGADSPCCDGGVSSPGADPMDVKARLKAWAHAVALTSTTQLGS